MDSFHYSNPCEYVHHISAASLEVHLTSTLHLKLLSPKDVSTCPGWRDKQVDYKWCGYHPQAWL